MCFLRWLIGRAEDDYIPIERPYIPGDGRFGVETVGESNYQRSLEDIVGGRSEDSAEFESIATLVPETENSHDANAVRVDIDGRTVGYLNRRDAALFRDQLAIAGDSVAITTCSAMIVGGWDRGPGDRGHFGVRLDLPSSDE